MWKSSEIKYSYFPILNILILIFLYIFLLLFYTYFHSILYCYYLYIYKLYFRNNATNNTNRLQTKHISLFLYIRLEAIKLNATLILFSIYIIFSLFLLIFFITFIFLTIPTFLTITHSFLTIDITSYNCSL